MNIGGGPGRDPRKPPKQDEPPPFNFDESMEDIEQAGNPLTPRRSSRIASKSPRVSQLGFSQINLGLSSEKEEEEKSPEKEMMAANYTTKKANKK